MNANSKYPLSIILTAGAALASAATVVLLMVGEGRLINIPLHSTVEVFGGFAAITLGMIIMFQRSAKSLFQSAWISCGLLSMGILDIFHGGASTGNLFVWLRSISSLIGGIFFFLVWFGQGSGFKKPLAYGISAAAVFIGIISVVFQEALPPMIEEGAFTSTARYINILGGIFYIAAAPAFLISYIRKREGRDDIIIFAISVLFGLAGLLFHFSEPWSASWWYWHSLRLMALVTVLFYAIVFFKNAEDKYKTIIQTTMDGFCLVDSRGRFLDVNDSYCKLIGYTREELLRMRVVDIEAKEKPEEVARHLSRIVKDGSDRFETKHKGKDGKILDIEISLNYLDISGGQFFVFLRDITSRKRSEEEVLRLNAELAQKIVEIKEAQEELVRKEKLSILGQLAGSVGHELRNPLGVMSNAVYFLKMTHSDADETTKEYLRIIEQEIVNSQHIITDLLDFTRTKRPQAQSVVLNELVGEGVRKAVPVGYTATVDIPEELHRVKADPLQIGQVFCNLITNAVQAMPAGGNLNIKAEESLEDGAVRVSFRDTGTGITPENMKKLFQPLFTTKARGIGLGLVVCKNLVEANEGRIEVESRPGEGTTFMVILPIDRGGV
ncbi:MAG: PAS domain S-box protein [Deltaproteobacteria bacterium]|nr:PAS domain S-box protein [Deltaproteobacteria bacterium]